MAFFQILFFFQKCARQFDNFHSLDGGIFIGILGSQKYHHTPYGLSGEHKKVSGNGTMAGRDTQFEESEKGHKCIRFMSTIFGNFAPKKKVGETVFRAICERKNVETCRREKKVGGRRRSRRNELF